MKRCGMCLTLLLLCAIHFAAFADVVDASVCEVLADPASFDGKMIRIKDATVVVGFDEFLVDGSACNPATAIWLAYPEGTKGKAGPAAFVRLQLAKNAAAVADAPKRLAVTLQKNDAFRRFDSLLATPHRSSAMCLGCARYTVTATLVGRLDGVNMPDVMRDKSGKATALAGFGNLNLYRARLVLQVISDVVPHEINYAASAKAVKGDLRRAGSRPAADQVRRAVAAFGEEGEDNGVLVGFGTANEVLPDDGAKGNRESPDGLLFHASFDLNRLGKQMLDNAMAHVGTHIADVRAGLAQELAQAEARAWQTTVTK